MRVVAGRDELAYWPLAARFLIGLVVVFVLVVITVEVGLVGYAYERLGLSRYWVYAALVAAILGSRLNIAIARLPSQVIQLDRLVRVFGVPHVVPALVDTGETVVAVNVGGAVVPSALAIYLVARDHLGAGLPVAVALVTVVAFVAARPVPGVGIVVPTLVPPAAAVAAALLVGGHAPAAVAFVSGTIGTLVGADLLHLRGLPRLGASVLSIGGSGTFDGIFVTGVVAVLFAAR